VKIWSSLFGALGLVGLVFGFLSVFLWLFGAPTDLVWIGANFILGIVLIFLWAVLSLDQLRERLSSGEARRAGKYGTSAVLSTLASLAIVASVAFLTTRYTYRVDASEAGLHSLSDQTLGVLAALEQDVEVVAFYPPLETPKVRDVLDRYGYASERFHVQYADPNARPDLVERFGVDSAKLNEGIVRVAIGPESVDVADPTEQNLTNALVKLTRTGEKKVYFLEGHGERPIAGEQGIDAPGFSGAADALRNENYQVETLLLATRGEVPDDADVVVSAGPTRPFLPAETRALDLYLERGGALLVMVDPRANTDLYDDLEAWGVALGEDVIVDRVQGLFGRATTPFAAEYAAHPITEGMREVTMFHMARSVKSLPEAGSFVEIVRTGEESWGETDLDLFFSEGRAELTEGDVRGPVPLALAGTPAVGSAGSQKGEEEAGSEAAEPRLVVFGDSDFASNQLISAGVNSDLFVNAVNWLLGDVEFISVRPQSSRASGRQLTTEQVSNIRYLSLFLLPEAIAVAGVFAWWSRRRAPGR
jgi:ABC-type uncharacterized transport system involved in gliding motility auxiliary subunit